VNAAYVSMPRDGINRTDLCQVRNASYGGNAGAEIITSYLLAVIVYPEISEKFQDIHGSGY